MNLDELQSVRDRERQTDKLQQLRESFYEDAGELIQQLRRERERAADEADDPFDSRTVTQLTDEIRTAEQMVEAIYEKRIGKIVKAASFDAAGLPAEAEGMTAEEQDLFDNLVRAIQQNRERVLAVIGGSDAGDASSAVDLGPPPAERDATEGVPAAAAMGGETGDDGEENDGEEPTAPYSDDAIGDLPDETATSKQSPTPPPQRDHPPDSGTDETRDEGASRTEPATDDRTGGGPEEGPDIEPSNRDADTDETPAPDADHDSDTDGSGSSEEPDNDDENPVREDGSGASSGPAGTAPAGAVSDAATDDVQRKTVRVLESVETFVGFDDRDYDLEDGDVVTLPTTNADLLLERGVARELD